MKSIALQGGDIGGSLVSGMSAASPFARRQTQVVVEPVCFSDEFATDPAKVAQWTAFVSEIEDFNAVQAWMGSLLGNAYADVRRPLVSSLNVCDLVPLSAVWSGPRRGPQNGLNHIGWGSVGNSVPGSISFTCSASSIIQRGGGGVATRRPSDQIGVFALTLAA